MKSEEFDSINDEITFGKSGDDPTGSLELLPNTTSPLVHIIFRAKKPGKSLTFVILQFQNERYHLPVFINVLHPGLNFDRDFLDFGLIGDRNVNK